MNLVYIGLLILMCSISFAVIYCTLFYIAVRMYLLQKLYNKQIEARKKAFEFSKAKKNDIFTDTEN